MNSGGECSPALAVIHPGFCLAPLAYDTISAKARMSSSLKHTLRNFFATVVKQDHTKSFLRVSSNNKSKTARSTTYVICEGRIDSKLCFARSKSPSDKTLWITPNGWKTATIACGALFTAECRVICNGKTASEMKYRFARVEETTLEERFGAWDANAVDAFASLDHTMSREMQTNLSKISKQLIAAVHCTGPQKMLLHRWEELKRALPSDLLTLAIDLEANPRICSMPVRDQDVEDAAALLTSVANSGKRARSCSAILPEGMLTQDQILASFQRVDETITPRVVCELLFWLEASLGARPQYVLDFLQVIERVTLNLWKQVQFRIPLEVCFAKCLGREECTKSGARTPGQWIQAYITRFAEEKPALELRACLFVFARLSEAYPTLDIMRKEKERAFLRKITLLPEVTVLRKFLEL